MKFHTVRNSALIAVSSLGMLYGGQVMAQEKYIGELFLTASNFCPKNSLAANGQIIAIQTNTALFSLLGTTYGGNGQSTFALPDLRGRSPIGWGQGIGLSNLSIGETGGTETTTLTQNNLPPHSHQISSSTTTAASTKAATHSTPAPDRVPAQTMNAGGYIAADQADTELGEMTTTSTASVVGGYQPVGIRDPYLAMTWCIVVQGIFPPRD